MKLRGKRRAYVLTFNRHMFTDYQAVHNRLVALPEVENWSHYIEASYVLISYYSASVLGKEIQRIMPDNRFLLIEVNLRNRNGWLPEDAWTWLKKQKDKIDDQNLFS